MSDPSPRPVLGRIAAAHAGVTSGKGNLSDTLNTGLTRAIRRAALPFEGLLPQITDVVVTCATTLSKGVAALPDHGLLAAMEDEEGRRGLIALDNKLVDALIEVQATGRVEAGDLPPRPVTRIDEALCRDFLDLMLSAFAKETATEAGRDWPDRMSYGSRIADRTQLNLLLPEQGYHLLKASVSAAGRKHGALVLLLPADAAIARRRMLAAPSTKGAKPADWSVRMMAAVGSAPMVLDAVLTRVTLPLGRVEALAKGDLIPFQRADLGAITLEGEGEHVFARGGLGQFEGNRAVRLGVPGAAVAGARSASGGVPGATSMPGAAPPMGGRTTGISAAGGLPPLAAGAAPTLAGLPLMAGFDPDAVMGGGDPNALIGAFDPNALMGGFDPDAPMG